MRQRVFNLYFMFFMTSSILKPRVSLTRKVKRTIVVLKSPFHYKTPKHHITYSYWVVHCSFAVRPRHAETAQFVVGRYFVQNKPHRVQVRRPVKLSLGSLVLQC